mgnify:CR=1 FL=1
MPEGDTIHKVALYLRPRLVGESLQPPPKPLPPSVATLSGDRVQSVSAVGKHLIIATDLRSLQVHLGMRGTWHHYRRRERWKVSESQARVVLTARCGVLVCFRAPQVTVRLRKQSNPPSSVGRLGPDILAPDVDFPGLVRRARRFSAASPLIIDMLLDQQIACGIGNAFKSEILFLEQVKPTATVDSLSDAVLLRLFQRARTIMVPNLSGGPRTTTVDISRYVRPNHLPRYWVYGRRHEPCLTCGSRIERSIMGRHSRVTYWCNTCQTVS